MSHSAHELGLGKISEFYILRYEGTYADGPVLCFD